MTDPGKGAFEERVRQLQNDGKDLPILWNHIPTATLSKMTPEQFSIAMNNVMRALEARSE